VINHEALARENREPIETPRRLPPLFAVLVVALAAWGATYLWRNAGEGSSGEGDRRTAAALAARPADGPIDGKALFEARCAACHQQTGLGLPGAFPPLAGSEWALGAPLRPASIVVAGLGGSIEVKGQTFQGQMPTFRDQLTDAEIAAILTYVRGAWGNGAPPVDVATVAGARASLAGHAGPIQGQEELVRLVP
jgi:mono/diheme cytochrome c family protein